MIAALNNPASRITLQSYFLRCCMPAFYGSHIFNCRALHLRKIHAQCEAYFEIWLGLEYRLLPVKFRQIDSSDEVTDEFVIADIRAAEE